MAKKGIYPAPVYEAHFADGSVIRTPFFSPAGKPVDFKRGARTAAMIAWHAHPEALMWQLGRPQAHQFRSKRPAGHKGDSEAARQRYEKARAVWAEASREFYRTRGVAWPVWARDVVAARWVAPKPKDWLGEDQPFAKVIVDGYAYTGETFNGEGGKLIGRDPRFETARKRPTATVATMKALLARVLANEPEAIEQARRMVA